MVNQSHRSLALIAVSVCLVVVLSLGCIPKKLPTSQPGRSGMPSGVYDPGIAPEPWEIDPNLMPIYPGAMPYGGKHFFITPDPYIRVLNFYKEKLPNAKIEETPGSNPSAIFTTELFNLKLEIGEGGVNTVITFSRPKK